MAETTALETGIDFGRLRIEKVNCLQQQRFVAMQQLVATTMPSLWADTPLKLIKTTGVNVRTDIPSGHAAIICAQTMAQLHNLIFRAFNASYNQCLGVKAGTPEAQSFLLYNQSLWEAIHHHHGIEENFLFPALQKLAGDETVMSQNIEEHKELAEGLGKLHSYAFETDPKEYNGNTLQAILDILGSKLEAHLHAEIPSLMDLAKYDSAEVLKAWTITSKKADQSAPKTRIGPMLLGCGDRSFLIDDNIPSILPVPGFVPYLSKYVLERPRAGAWRFNPCDSFGNRRPLAFPNQEPSESDS
ncbi:hypothetical protein FQN57_006044 [Myotisia sp. PD_48]|nr:hypothetical protein FQN57_006044 [Myotisia sp. PD_48]